MVKKKFQIGITSPTYNESENIETFIKGILRLTDTFDINICFVDDDSKDNTVEIIEKFKNKFHKLHIIKREKKETTQVYSAYHDGLKWLYKNTHANSFAQIDSDNICDVQTIRRAFNILQNHPEIDLVKLSKYSNNQFDDREFIRRLLSKIYTIICKLFYDRKITDYSTGIRFYNKNLTQQLIHYKKNFTSPIGLLDDLLWIINNKFLIKEIDFKINERKFGNSFFRIGLIFSLGIDFIYCIFIHLIKNN